MLSDHETEVSTAAKEHNGADLQKPVKEIGAIRKPPGIRDKISDSSSSSDTDTVKANSVGSKTSNKKKPPPLPSTAPKIISHCLKRDAANKVGDKSSETNGNTGMSVKNNINNNSIYVKSNSINQLSATMFDKADIYNNPSMGGSEIYNNPQFMLNSPPQSLRSRNSKQSHSSRSTRKHMEVMDQYSNPMLLRQQNALRNIQKMPDMVYEALTNDYTQRNACGPYGQINRLLPTPDYDDPRSTLSSIKERYANVTEDPFHVPTPDYNTPVRSKNGKIYQPDSPIYHRKSPHYLIVDYETDSLERSHVGKMSRNSLTPHSNNSSDIGSQPSPSLSSALPLEEEMEVRNTVYDRIEGFRKDGDHVVKNTNKHMQCSKSIYEEVRSMTSAREPRIRYNTPFHGSMTIEVEHSPTDTEISTDSDQFEPDTLDRKPKKLNNAAHIVKPDCTSIPNNQKQVNAWNNHLQKSADFLNQIDSNIRYSSLENMTSLPDMKVMNNQNNVDSQVVLRSSGSFKSNSLGTYYSEIGAITNNHLDKNFCSLREIYEAKNQKNLQSSPSVSELDFEEKGRLLTLEARHSKRQRQITLEKKKKSLPPDLIPLKRIGEQAKSAEDTTKSKNLTGWNTDEANDKVCKNKSIKSNNNTLNYERPPLSGDSTSSSGSTSESTDITGVSEAHLNSVRRPYSQVHKKSPLTKLKNEPKLVDIEETNYCNLSDIRSSSSQQEQSDCNSESSTIKSSSTKFYYRTNLFQHAKNNNALKQIDDTDKIETLSSKSIPQNIDRPILMDDSATDLIKELATNTTGFSPSLGLNPTKVFRVDVNTATNGMQIALGLKVRVKKSKDLKNAWKKFVNMATSKFQGTIQKPDGKTEFDTADRASSLSDRDDGIASLNACDENGNICTSSSSNLAQILSRTPSSSSSDITNRQSRSEMDYGYISADSNESRANNKKLYERFNFKANKTNSACSSSSDANETEAPHKNMMRMQEIKEMSESERSSLPSVKDDSTKSKRDAPKLVDFIPKNIVLNVSDAVDVNVYSSSDEDRYSNSSGMSSDEEGHLDLDEMCESGAESVETNSVFFKKIRKVPKGN